ncbi:hypothetical protein MKX01_005727 [Papaver californicum]|nr:hypothetical protein MKX01_005727 [Papaver californicum]
MAFRRTLTRRIFNKTLVSKNFIQRNLNIPSNPVLTTFNHECLTDSKIGREEEKSLRNYFQKREISHSTSSTQQAVRRSLPVGENLIEKLKSINNIGNDRIRLDGLIPPPSPPPPVKKGLDYLDGISVKDAKKLLKLAHLEMLKSNLKQIEKKSITYSEFVDICVAGSNSHDQGVELAKMLDDSGSVIVLGNIVFLHPEEVTRAIGGIIPLPLAPNDAQKKELEKMEKEKAQIDARAEALVRRELWGGLAFFTAQTAAFLRLTFWELSWDVMEPICFYVTSMYFMAGYTFFLRTSKEPTLQGFFESRFISKRKQLMKMKNFDIKRFNELKGSYPYSMINSQPSGAESLVSMPNHPFELRTSF